MDRRRPSKLIENNTILVDNDDNGDGGFTSISDATIDDDDTEVDDEDDDEVDDNDDDDDDDTEVDDDDATEVDAEDNDAVDDGEACLSR